jgi:preprotein translocase subunit SecF
LDTTVNVRKLTEAGSDKGIILDADLQSDEEVETFIATIQEKTGPLSDDEISVQVVGSALGASFFAAVMKSIIAAFIMIAIVVFVYFRFAAGRWILVPSLFIVWTVLVDMIGTFAVVSLLQIKVSTAGLAAFLLLIGYSVDTDILLTMRMLKSRQEKVFDRVMTAAKTGVFMTLTGIAAITAGLLFTQSETIRQIMLILVIGLTFDLIHTWITNTGVLRWYMERDMYGKK